jgi:uncharacterized membrane protein YfcA
LRDGTLRGHFAALSFWPEISTQVYCGALCGAFCLGFSKTGFPGLALVNVMLMAEIFGAKESVGIILPLLICADITVFPMFRKFATWKQVVPLLVPISVGLVGGYLLLGSIDNRVARPAIGGIILAMTGLQLLRVYRQEFLKHLPDAPAFRWGSGLVIGVSTMMANAAGPAYSIYALVHKMKKEDFLGIGARCFLLVNMVKVPFMTDLDIINARSLSIDLALLPGVFTGILVGRKLIAKIPQRIFEIFLYIFSIIAGGRLLLF